MSKVKNPEEWVEEIVSITGHARKLYELGDDETSWALTVILQTVLESVRDHDKRQRWLFLLALMMPFAVDSKKCSEEPVFTHPGSAAFN